MSDKTWGLSLSLGLGVLVWGLGKFSISVPFLPNCLFVPLLPVSFLKPIYYI